MDNANLTRSYTEEFPSSQRTLEIKAVVILVLVVIIFAWLIYSTTCDTTKKITFLVLSIKIRISIAKTMTLTTEG